MSDWDTSELHLAAYDCDLEYVVERIAAGDDVNLKDSKGFAPLHWCALRGVLVTTNLSGRPRQAFWT